MGHDQHLHALGHAGQALANRGRFPVDVNRADREMLLRIPGLGVKSVDRLIGVRRFKAIRLEDLGRLSGSVKRLQPFVICADWRPMTLDDAGLEQRFRATAEARPVQMTLL